MDPKMDRSTLGLILGVGAVAWALGCGDDPEAPAGRGEIVSTRALGAASLADLRQVASDAEVELPSALAFAVDIHRVVYGSVDRNGDPIPDHATETRFFDRLESATLARIRLPAAPEATGDSERRHVRTEGKTTKAAPMEPLPEHSNEEPPAAATGAQRPEPQILIRAPAVTVSMSEMGLVVSTLPAGSSGNKVSAPGCPEIGQNQPQSPIFVRTCEVFTQCSMLPAVSTAP